MLPLTELALLKYVRVTRNEGTQQFNENSTALQGLFSKKWAVRLCKRK